MDNTGVIRLVSLITVIFIVLTLQYFYKTRFRKEFENNESGLNKKGLVIIVVSILMAIIWMWLF